MDQRKVAVVNAFELWCIRRTETICLPQTKLCRSQRNDRLLIALVLLLLLCVLLLGLFYISCGLEFNG